MQNLNVVLQLAVVLEISLVNLIVANCCLTKKYAQWKHLLALGASALVIIGGGFAILRLLPIYGNGNGLFVFFGFFFLIPMRLLYRERLRKIFLSICCAWVFSLSTFSIVVQIASLWQDVWFTAVALIIQTALFLAFTPFVVKFVRRVCVVIFEDAAPRTQNLIQLTCVLWFVTIFMVHFSYVISAGLVFQIAGVLLLFANAGLTYYLIYQLVGSNRKIDKLKHTVYLDSLTELPNRRSFASDIASLAEEDMPGRYIFFLDLDRFKSVNDGYGHLAGDEYLQTFARVTAPLFAAQRGALYRLSGDEFVGTAALTDPEEFSDTVRAANQNCEEFRPPFIGVSIGYTAFTSGSDADGLLDLADEAMYVEKRRKATLQSP